MQKINKTSREYLYTDEDKKATTLGDLGIMALEGINENSMINFRNAGISTIGEISDCNPFLVHKKVKGQVYEVMKLKNRAQALLELRFESDILESLSKKEFTIQKTLELNPSYFEKITDNSNQRIFRFLESLAFLAIYMKLSARMKIGIGILKEIETPEEAKEQNIVISETDERDDFSRLLSNNKIAMLLERMLEGWIKELNPQWDMNTKLGFLYPEAEEILDPNNVAVNKILKELYQADILQRYFYDKLFRCPFCESPNILMRYSCIRCGSRDIQKEDMIQHYKCGHVDLAKKYKSGDKLVCPKCAAELQSLGKDFLKPGIMFECNNCGDISGSTYKKMYCTSCNSIIEKDKEILENVWIYKINPEKRELLIELLNPKQKIKDILEQNGFSFINNKVDAGKIKGLSKITHYFDIYAEKDKENLLIEFASDENQVEIDSLYTLYAKAQDLGINYAILFSFPKTSEEAHKFAQYYNLYILEAENLSNASPLFEKLIDNILSTKFSNVNSDFVEYDTDINAPSAIDNRTEL